MGIQFDIVIPPIIAGVVIMLIFQVNSFMLSTSVDNRLGFEMQNFAEATADVIHTEVRLLKNFKLGGCQNSSCEFLSTNGDSVAIFQDNNELIIRRKTPDAVITEQSYSSRLDSLNFIRDGSGDMLTFLVITTSRAEQEVGPDDGQRVKGFAERIVFLRNIAYSNTK